MAQWRAYVGRTTDLTTVSDEVAAGHVATLRQWEAREITLQHQVHHLQAAVTYEAASAGSGSKPAALMSVAGAAATEEAALAAAPDKEAAKAAASKPPFHRGDSDRATVAALKEGLRKWVLPGRVLVGGGGSMPRSAHLFDDGDRDSCRLGVDFTGVFEREELESLLKEVSSASGAMLPIFQTVPS